MKITVLVENTGKEPLKCEHGLSLLIEFQGNKYLLDAGTSDIFMENAKRLDENILDIKTCFLSHGHYDHSGGFGTYLQENQDAVVYAMNTADQEFFSGSGEWHEIGIPKGILEAHGKRFYYVDKVTEISEGVYIIPHNTSGLAQIGERAKLYRKQDEEYLPDDFAHELSLVFETEKGLVLFNSCSHGGVQNIVKEVQEALPGRNVYAYLGGLHMKGKQNGKDICTFTVSEVEDLVDFLKTCGVEYLYTGHCTGEPALELLKTSGGEMVHELTTGKIIEL